MARLLAIVMISLAAAGIGPFAAIAAAQNAAVQAPAQRAAVKPAEAAKSGETTAGYLYFRSKEQPVPAQKLSGDALQAASGTKPVRTARSTQTGGDIRVNTTPAPVPSRTTRSATVERRFSFTPAGHIGDPKAVLIGVSSRVSDPATRRSAGLGTDLYDVGLSVGYRGFELATTYSRVDDRKMLSGESVDLGVSYGGKDWRTGLHVGGEEYGIDRPSPLGLDRSYSVELGGSYLLTPRLSVLGGVKYSISYASEELLDVQDAEQRNSAVFLGTRIDF